MATSKTAEKNHEELFPKHPSTFKVTDRPMGKNGRK